MQITGDILTKALNRKRMGWVDMVMKEVLPPDVYGKMHGDHEERRSAVGWLKEHGYYYRDVGDGVIQVFRGTALVRQTKLVLELDNPEELLSIAEAVTQNINIPAPPWDPKSGKQ